mgnify:CR=1 FL=1
MNLFTLPRKPSVISFDYRIIKELAQLPLQTRYERVLESPAIQGHISSTIDQLINTHHGLIENRAPVLAEWGVLVDDFIIACRELFYDLLIASDAYLSLITAGESFFSAPLKRLHPLLLQIEGGVSMETTSYTYDGQYHLNWNDVIHVAMSHVPSVGWRYFGWLPSGKVKMGSCDTMSDAFGQTLDSLILDSLIKENDD